MLLAPIGSVSPGAAAASSYPYTTRSIYEHNVDPTTLYRQGCNAGRASANGVIILDFGRPAFRSEDRVYGTIDYGNNFDGNPAILRAMEHFATGYRYCLPSGSSAHVYIARGTNNSCSNQDPVCCPHRCRHQPPSFTKAGINWAIWTHALASYISSHGWNRWESASAADDAEPAWDPAFTNTGDFLAGYASQYGYTYPMWDYGSMEPGYWSPSQEYAVAFGYAPDVPFPEIYNAATAEEWEALSLWAVANTGRAMTIWGVLSQHDPGFGCGYTSHEGYDAMLAQLQSHSSTYQSSIRYASDIPCSTSA